MRFWRMADTAEAAGDAEGMAIAALGLGGIWVHEHRASLDKARVESLQRSALARLDPGSSLAHRLRTRLAAEHAYVVGDPGPVLEALDDARRLSDPVVLAEALSLAHHCLLGPHHTDLRLALASELIAVSPRTGRALDGLMGLAWRTVDLVLRGDRLAGRALSELRTQLAVEPCDALRFLADAIEVMFAIREGRLTDAEALAGACYDFGLDVGDADALGWYGAQLIAIRWLQGRADELLPLVREIADSSTIAEPAAGFVAAVAALAGAAGDRDAARTALACLRAAGLATVSSSSSWSATMLGVCEAAHLLDDVDAARDAYELLVPFADLPVMASIGVTTFGSAHRPLALAAWTMGDLDLAIGHLESAIAADLATGDAPWQALAAATLSDALEARGRPGDRQRATELRAGAIAAARRFGMDRRADEWQERMPATSAECRRDGRVWTVRVGDRSVSVPHCVGLEYLGKLIANADVEIAAIDLASAHSLPATTAARSPQLDAEAVASYRRRIHELRSAIDDADACADIERASLARIELDELIDGLARSTGLAGTIRSFTDDTERARVSVCKAIKRALRMIADADSALGEILARRVVTGVRCTYRSA